MNKERLTRWLVSGPPLVFMVVFFVLPALIMVLASFRFPGEHGGLAPLVEDGRIAASRSPASPADSCPPPR